MFLRLVYQSFRRQKRRKLLAGVSITLGVAVATAMVAVATDIGDKVNRELRSYGANLVVYPAADSLDVEIGGVSYKPAARRAFLNESDLPNIRGIFWRHNIVAFAPTLSTRANLKGTDVEVVGTYFAKELRYGQEAFTTGARQMYPWWRVEGEWPRDGQPEVLAGEKLASRLELRRGQRIAIGGQEAVITGVLSTGGAEDGQLVTPLALAQAVAAHPGAVQRIYVSALTKPEDELARRDPSTLSPELYDRWYCTPYVQSIAKQLQEAIPHGKAEQIRQVAQNEGAVLSRIKGLMLLITLAALLASALAVSAAMATAILERRREVGLMKAMGAGNVTVGTLFFTEAALLAFLAGIAGFGGGVVLAQQIGKSVFSARVNIDPVLFPLVMMMAVLVTFAGSAASIRRAMRFDPAIVLRGDA